MPDETTPKRRPAIRATPDMLARAVAAYEAGASAVHAGRSAGLSQQQVLAELRRRGIRARHAGSKPLIAGSTAPDREYAPLPVAAGFFESIDSDTAAYLFGLICADGSVDRRGRVKVALAEQDREILVHVHRLLGGSLRWEKPQRGWQAKWVWVVWSKRLAQSLIERGVLPGKDKVLPVILPPRGHERAFVRGLIDGDGKVTFVAGRGTPRIAFVNRNESLRKAVADEFMRISGEAPSEYVYAGRYATVYARAEASVRIAQALYLTKGTLSMERKRLAAWDIAAWGWRRHGAAA